MRSNKVSDRRVPYRGEPKARAKRASIAAASEDDFAPASAVVGKAEYEAWFRRKVTAALRKAEAGGPFIAHEDVVAWMKSLGTKNPLPKPKATISTKPRKAK